MNVESRQRAPRARASNQQWAEMRRSQPRPTAPQSYQRPPDSDAEERSSWWPVFWLLCLILVTALMVSRQLSTPPIALSDLRESAVAIVPLGLSARLVKFMDASAEQPAEATNESNGSGRWSIQNLRDRFSPSVGSLAPSSTSDTTSDNSEATHDDGAKPRREPLLVLDDAFQPPLVVLASSAEDDRWMMDFLPREQAADQSGLYRMRAWPDTIAWTSISWPAGEITGESTGNSTSESILPTKFRVETTMQINPVEPEGYGGFLARYQDEQNYYLLQFDGAGHYRTLLRKNGEWSSSEEWRNTAAINLAGMPNTIAVEDSGDLLRIYANGAPLDEFAPVLPIGSTGLIAGAKSEGTIEVDYYGLTLYELY